MTGNNTIELESTASTQDYLRNLLSGNQLPEGTLVHTANQTAGHGLDGNIWESSPGLNLSFSFVWYPEFLHAQDQFRLNKAVALAVLDFVAAESAEASVKWPNDIYIGDRKVAGILIENSIMDALYTQAIIGIGLNLNQEQFSAGIPNPFSLRLATGKTYSMYSSLDMLCALLDKRYEQLRITPEEIDRAYLDNLYRYGVMSRYIYRGKEVSARITGLSRFGQLLLQTSGGKQLECGFKEIRFLSEDRFQT